MESQKELRKCISCRQYAKCCVKVSGTIGAQENRLDRFQGTDEELERTRTAMRAAAPNATYLCSLHIGKELRQKVDDLDVELTEEEKLLKIKLTPTPNNPRFGRPNATPNGSSLPSPARSLTSTLPIRRIDFSQKPPPSPKRIAPSPKDSVPIKRMLQDGDPASYFDADHFAFNNDTEETFQSEQTNESPPTAPMGKEKYTSSPLQSALSPEFHQFFIVDGRQLAKLFKFCRECGEPANGVSLKTHGTCAVVSSLCTACGPVTWESQRRIGADKGGRGYEYNTKFPAAMHTTGLHYTAVAEAMKEANTAFFSQTAYHDTLAHKVMPASKQIYGEKMVDMLKFVKERNPHGKVSIGIDTQYDSPGHSANLARVTFMEQKTEIALHSEIVHKSETGNQRMEKEGTRRGLLTVASLIEPYGLEIESVTTDQSPSLQTLFRQEFSHLRHLLDVWHLQKSLCSAIRKIAAGKQKKDVLLALRKIRGSWFRAHQNALGDTQLLIETFNSVLMHLAGIHEWEPDHNFSLVLSCEHDQLDPSREDAVRFSIDDPVYKQICEVVLNKKLQAALHRVDASKCTSCNESLHSTYLKYSSKRISMTREAWAARTNLGCMHWNHLASKRCTGERRIVHSRLIKRKGRDFESELKIYKGGEDHSWRADIVKRTMLLAEQLLEEKKKATAEKKALPSQVVLDSEEDEEEAVMDLDRQIAIMQIEEEEMAAALDEEEEVGEADQAPTRTWNTDTVEAWLEYIKGYAHMVEGLEVSGSEGEEANEVADAGKGATQRRRSGRLMKREATKEKDTKSQTAKDKGE